MSVTDYKSSLHYLALQPSKSGLSFEEFLLYFSNKDIGKLDLAISETILRDAFYKRLGSYYNTNKITCLGEFKMISNRHFALERYEAPDMSIGKKSYTFKSIQLPFFHKFLFVIDNEQKEQFLANLLERSPILSAILFTFISNVGLEMIASSRCAPSLRTIDAKVNNDAVEAIQTLCQASPDLRSLNLRNDIHALEGDAITQTVVQHCPLIEALPTYLWNMTDTSLNALANIHTLKQAHIFDYDYSKDAVQRVLEANPNLVAIGLGCVDDALVRCIGRCCGNLTRLVLGQGVNPVQCSDALVDLFRGCTRLESLKLCLQGVISITVLYALFEYCHHLTTLELLFMLPGEHLLITEPVLYTCYPALTKLKVANHGISGSALQSIITYCTNLKEVTLCSCKQLTDDILITLVQNCTCLKSLSLSSCLSATIAGLLEVATHCSSLSVLYLHNMPVNGDLLLQLSHYCTDLTRLTFMQCYGGPITEAGVVAVVERCTGLTFFSLRGNVVESLLHTLDVTKLQQLYPHITFEITGRCY